MSFTPTALPDVILFTPRRFGDPRGWFSETYNEQVFSQNGIPIRFVQDNHSYSAPIHTVRGLHFQKPPHAQAKLVRCVRGAILDVAVDIRLGSPTFAQHVAVKLTAEGGEQLFVPEGFAHGFVTLLPDTEVVYKVSSLYAPAADAGYSWQDPAFAIDWGIEAALGILSQKDSALPTLSAAPSPFTL
ncbi:MAG: dTDP-4-dehydrorhamnose 3,5-epimerase [Alphaproteobacteria bacterium]|nr:dTDP-4-dehydrorhamnose 3,5-epimerase [Thalassospira sp.]MCE2965771.1 dTDP-4-dehydrorhamnose 3,5-epimerase [Alphaproteobacteria bacterium]